MPYFTKKPVKIEARQFDGSLFSAGCISLWMSECGSDREPIYAADNSLIIPTLEGDHRAISGDWIIKGVKGEFYPCKPDIFEQTYEPTVEGGLRTSHEQSHSSSTGRARHCRRAGDRPMSRPLSPAAQAALDAFSDCRKLCGPFNDNWQKLCLASAIRAAADQVVPEEPLYGGDQRWELKRDARQTSRRKLLAIAAELEGAND